jgi:CDP-glycerol glycerophosphotransferase
VGALLPARDVVLVDTSDARPANSELRAIAQALADDHPEIPQAWVHRGRPTRVPLTATPVERLSIRHHWLGARARWRLDDGTSTLGVRYRPSGATIRPLDGVPIHRIGLDDPTVLSERGLAKEVRRRAKRWTSVLTASQFAADVTETAFAKPTGALVVGSARLDATLRLTQAGSSAREELRRELDLPGDRAIVLYAPVGRTTGRAAVDPPLDLDLWASELGERAYLLVRAHPSEKFHVSTRHRYAIRDISDPDLVDPFLVTCDLVVSDYSSIIADAAALDRPIALFQPDYDSYVHRQHGLYVDLSAVGPRARSTSELIDLTREWLDDPRALETAYRDGRQGFVATHCGPLDAGSCQRAIAAILAVGR